MGIGFFLGGQKDQGGLPSLKKAPECLGILVISWTVYIFFFFGGERGCITGLKKRVSREEGEPERTGRA